MSAPDTRDRAYTERLAAAPCWKRWLDVQAPYRWNVRRLARGQTLDVGCGTGRNLAHLGGRGVGVDHNQHSVAAARARGLSAFTSAEFERSAHAGGPGFDTLLVAHVLEHMSFEDACALVGRYLPCLLPGGRIVLITPQEAGFASDPTHVAFTGFAELERILEVHGLTLDRRLSFPFPRLVGRVFAHNEFIVVGLKL